MPLHEYPFTQLIEDVAKELKKDYRATEIKNLLKSRINRILMRDLPGTHEFRWLQQTTSILLTARYNTGTIDITAGSTSVTSGDTSPAWNTTHSGLKMFISGNDEVYTFTQLTATTGTISPAYTGTSNLDEGTYTLYEDTYDLPVDFDRVMTSRDAVYYAQGQSRFGINEIAPTDWDSRYTSTPSDTATGYRLLQKGGTNNFRRIQLSSPPLSTRYLNMEYISTPAEMEEFTSTAGVTLATTQRDRVTIVNTDVTYYATVGRYFRYDANSAWRRITKSVVVGVNTTIFLDSDYPITASITNNTTGFTISDVANVPNSIMEALFAGACWRTALSDGDQSTDMWAAQYGAEVSKALSAQARTRYGRQYTRRGTPWRSR